MPFALRYLRYLAAAKTRHGIHSPFIYKLVDEVIRVRTVPVSRIEKIRLTLSESKDRIEVTDHGAAGSEKRKEVRQVSRMARRSAKPAKYASLLCRLAAFYRPSQILELGTSFGISAMYLAEGNPSARVVTLEGCSNTAAIARKNFSEAGYDNIESVTGAFNETLPRILGAMDSAGMVFFDGHHQEQATLRYFALCKEKRNDQSVFVFDDINWSQGMRSAWTAIKADPEVTATVDLFMMGLVFFNKDLQKQEFIIRF